MRLARASGPPGALAPFGAETVAATLEIYRAAMAKGEPLRIRGDGAWFGQDPKYFDAILAPLSDDGEAVNMLFGAFIFKWSFADVQREDPDAGERAWTSDLRTTNTPLCQQSCVGL